MIELIDGFPRHVVGISVKGRVTREECRDVLTPAVAKALRWRDKIGLYYELGSRFPGSGWDDLDFEHASCCERIAIVTEIAWVRLTVKAIRFLIPGEIRVFDTREAAEARAWITARSRSQPEIDARSLRVGDPRARRSRRGSAIAARPRVSARQQAPQIAAPEPGAAGSAETLETDHILAATGE